MGFESKNGEALPSYGEAMAYVQAKMAETMQMGANDSEMNSFHIIIEKLQDRELTPVDAMRQADAIKNSKQDYH